MVMMRSWQRSCRGSCDGFTLVELLIALAISGIVLGITISVFIFQQNSYKAQIRISALQQNLRTAMNIISSDIKMAGSYTYVDRESYSGYIDWDPRISGMDEFSPIIHGINDIKDIGKYRQNSDSILLVRAGDDRGVLKTSEFAIAGGKLLTLDNLDLDEDGDVDLNSGGRKFGVIVKADYSRSQLFKIIEENSPIKTADMFRETYSEGDFIARADIIIYRVDDKNKSFSQSVLERKNIGNGNLFQVVAEGITDLQLSYFLDDDSIVDDPSIEERNICAVKVKLTGDVEITGSGKRSRSLETIVKIRNAGV